jgi:hypothetical protein
MAVIWLESVGIDLPLVRGATLRRPLSWKVRLAMRPSVLDTVSGSFLLLLLTAGEAAGPSH